MREFDDRAVSTTVGYALSLGISALLISGLLIAGGGFLQDQRVSSTRSELTVIGHQVAADIASADRLVGTDATNIRVQRNLPDRVTGSAYTVTVETPPDVGNSHLVLTSAEPEVTIRIDIQVEFAGDIEQTAVDGGEVEVVYDSGADELVVRNV